MTQRLVLDAAAFDVLDAARAAGFEPCSSGVWPREAISAAPRSLLPRSVEAALARDRGGQRIRVLSTDERLAKLVGAILYETGSGSERLGDAHIVAICAGANAAVVLTSDPDDIVALAVAVPGARMVIRDPAAL